MKTKVSSVVLVVMFASLSACASKPVEPARPLDTSTERAPEPAPAVNTREDLFAALTDIERTPPMIPDSAMIEASREASEHVQDKECVLEQVMLWSEFEKIREVWTYDDVGRATRYTWVSWHGDELATVKIMSAEYVGRSERVARRVTRTADSPVLVSELTESVEHMDGERRTTTARSIKNASTGESTVIPRLFGVMTLDAEGRPSRERLHAEGAPEVVREWSYDERGRELSFMETRGGEEVERRSASYDRSGRLSRSHESIGVRYPTITDVEIAYNTDGSSTKVVSSHQAHAGAPAPSRREVLQDKQGREICARSLGESGCSQRWSYNDAGHLVRFEDDSDRRGATVTDFVRTSSGEPVSSIMRRGDEVVLSMFYVWKCD